MSGAILPFLLGKLQLGKVAHWNAAAVVVERDTPPTYYLPNWNAIKAHTHPQ